MIRAAFLRRMAAAALACAFFDVRVPEIESESAPEGWLRATVDVWAGEPIDVLFPARGWPTRIVSVAEVRRLYG